VSAETNERKYVEAIGRNPGEEYGHSHLYLEIIEDPSIGNDGGLSYLPMCRYVWNRSNGSRFSISRGWSGSLGLCRICKKRADAGLDGVKAKPGSHKTKWL